MQSPRDPKTRAVICGALASVAITLGYFLLFWNRFAGIRSGIGGFGAGLLFGQGVMPYRDYFLAATPMIILTSAGALKIFGNTLTVTHGLGVFERCLIAGILYLWLARLFSARHALMASVMAVVASAGDFSDPVGSYNHETILWAIASGYTASFELDREPSRRRMIAAALLSGLFAGMSFLTKQTMGLGATVFIPAAVSLCLCRFYSFSKAAKFLALFIGGWMIAAGTLLLWLNHLGILHEFFVDVFMKGPAAKGTHAGDFLSRYTNTALAQWGFLNAGLFALILSWKALRRSGVSRQSPQPESARPVLQVFLVCAVCVALGAAASYAGFYGQKSVDLAVIYFNSLGTFGLSACYAWLWLRGSLTFREAQFWLFATLSFVTALMVSLSFPIFEAMLLPGLGLLTAALLDAFDKWRRAAVYACCALLMVTLVCTKLARPFGFSSWYEPAVPFTTSASSIPELKGLHLAPGIVAFLDGAAKIVSDNSTSRDTIFTYPEMGIFYAITHRGFPTSSGSHNIDVVNDAFATEEAKRLLDGRPAVLIYYREPEENLFRDEVIWRHGRRSGQRDIIAAMETLAASYRLAASYKVPPDDRTVDVYVRP